MPVLGDPSHKDIISSLKTRVPQILRLNAPDAPRAIIVVTAHWSEKEPTISNGEKHGLLFDYGGFPAEAYKLRYPAPGSPAIAKEVYDALKETGLNPKNDPDRGWDHGVFIPLLLIHPTANIPIVQLSVLSSEDPQKHYLMGRALSRLRDSNIAIIGSGFSSFHNLRLMFGGITEDPAFRSRNKAWNDAVTAAVSEKGVEERGKKLESWRKYPAAYEMHPKGGAEHFLPLLVCAGAGGEAKPKSYTDSFMGLDMYSYYWD